MKIVKQLTELIGNTPLLELTNYEKELGLKAHIVAKLEYFNPLGSVKDRVAAAMIEQGIKDGLINQETVIIEPTSGNTGIGLASIAAVKGYRIILTMQETISIKLSTNKYNDKLESIKGNIDEVRLKIENKKTHTSNFPL